MVPVHFFGMGGHEHGRERVPLASLVPFDAAVDAAVFGGMMAQKRSRNSGAYVIGLAELLSYLRVGGVGAI
jgi:hypothetical protein